MFILGGGESVQWLRLQSEKVSFYFRTALCLVHQVVGAGGIWEGSQFVCVALDFTALGEMLGCSFCPLSFCASDCF